MGDIGNRGGYTCIRVEGVWETFVPSAQLCCDYKTALKMKVYLIKIIESIILKIRSMPVNLMNKAEIVVITFNLFICFNLR